MRLLFKIITICMLKKLKINSFKNLWKTISNQQISMWFLVACTAKKLETLVTISKHDKSQITWSLILTSSVNFTVIHSSCAQREHDVSFQPCLAIEQPLVRSLDCHCWVLKKNWTGLTHEQKTRLRVVADLIFTLSLREVVNDINMIKASTRKETTGYQMLYSESLKWKRYIEQQEQQGTMKGQTFSKFPYGEKIYVN